jgi:PTH1 family peptidyl-tRNA hydrolase
MNRSGEAVRACADYYALETGRILVVHDDLDLPLGRIKVVKDGGAGGHKGVASIIHHLESTQFSRVKVGIGRPRYGETVEDYVLAPFYADVQGLAEKVIRVAVNACELFVLEGVESAMNQINCQNLVNKEENN